MTRAALLDLDGTLVDSRPGIVASIHAALRDLGHAPDPTVDLTWAVGPPLDESLAGILAHYGDARTVDAVAAYRRHYGASGLFNATPYPGMTEAIDDIAAAGFDLILATSKRTVFARRVLDHFGFSRDFRAIYGSEDGGALDHKPELIAHILARENLLPGGCVMIGDRRHDIAGAHANALRAIGVTWGYGGTAELTEAGADALAEAPSDLFRLVRELV